MHLAVSIWKKAEEQRRAGAGKQKSSCQHQQPPLHLITTLLLVFREGGSIFLNMIFSKAGSREDLILAVKLKGRMEGELVHVPLSV